ncbi:SRPBCC family protein [Gordonia sp. (in: high G+C Gram-positive bacteria)]|uniref:SRPBCC family protein n=1 Tax=Gordonia sp. (in: high G+C Gram-positive bacteria) TaxID=84139 RepID=UPI00169040DB|nr:SRPBCC family protein [Gordonia sp. (in: high G+C Gram-positive bacteria)]NLG46431.1 polyketide cyclase/dehydrase [Gordonia sp. (in: high G+C Gram-positive bacteria)]
MIEMQRTVYTNAPVSAVYAYLADFGNAEDWDPNAIAVTRLSGNGGVGTEYRVESLFAGRSTLLDYRVTDLDPNKLIRLRGEKKAITAVDTITIVEGAARVAVTYAVAFEFNGVFAMVEPVLKIAVRRLLEQGAQGLSRELLRLERTVGRP